MIGYPLHFQIIIQKNLFGVQQLLESGHSLLALEKAQPLFRYVGEPDLHLVFQHFFGSMRNWCLRSVHTNPNWSFLLHHGLLQDRNAISGTRYCLLIFSKSHLLRRLLILFILEMLVVLRIHNIKIIMI